MPRPPFSRQPEISKPMTMRIPLLLGCLMLAACSDWPDIGEPPIERRNTAWPALLPLSQVIESGDIETADAAEAEDLAERAAALQRRARILRARARNANDIEALRSRLR